MMWAFKIFYTDSGNGLHHGHCATTGFCHVAHRAPRFSWKVSPARVTQVFSIFHSKCRLALYIMMNLLPCYVMQVDVFDNENRNYETK